MDSSARPLREHRLRQGLSIRALADAAEVTPQTVVNIEASSRRPHPGTMRRIAGALRVEISAVSEFATRIDEQLRV